MEVQWGAHANTSRRTEPVHPSQPLYVYEDCTQCISLPLPLSFFHPHLPIYLISLYACYSRTSEPCRWQHHNPSQCWEIPNDISSYSNTSVKNYDLAKTTFNFIRNNLVQINKIYVCRHGKQLHKCTFSLQATDWNIKDSGNRYTNSTKVSTSPKIFSVEISDIPTKRNPHQGDYNLICWLSSITNYMY